MSIWVSKFAYWHIRNNNCLSCKVAHGNTQYSEHSLYKCYKCTTFQSPAKSTTQCKHNLWYFLNSFFNLCNNLMNYINPVNQTLYCWSLFNVYNFQSRRWGFSPLGLCTVDTPLGPHQCGSIQFLAYSLHLLAFGLQLLAGVLKIWGELCDRHTHCSFYRVSPLR